jgi:hypothetical protein
MTLTLPRVDLTVQLRLDYSVHFEGDDMNDLAGKRALVTGGIAPDPAINPSNAIIPVDGGRAAV